MSTARELNLFTADLCNFACSHCIANADAKANKFRLSRAEVIRIASSINADPNVSHVHFVGGEPTLQLRMIELIQSLIIRPIHYAMTTNGWFSKNPESILGRIKLDEIRVSYDEYHAEFIESQQIDNLLKHCVQRGLKTALKLTIKSAADIAKNSWMLSPGVELLVSRFESTGKARKLKEQMKKDFSFWDKRCPSFRDSSTQIEAAVFFPGKGFTPCCSSLVFNESGNDDFVFSKSQEDYWQHNQLKKTVSNSFRTIAVKAGIDIENLEVSSACQACELIIGNLTYAGLPSLTSIAKIAQNGPFTSKILAKLSPQHLRMLSKNYRVYYQYEGAAQKYSTPASKLALLGIIREDVNSSRTALLLKIESDLMTNSQSPANESERLKQVEVMRSYIRDCTNRFVYFKNGEAIAALYLWKNFEHPILKKVVTHVGLLGISRTIEDHEIRKLIKQDFDLRCFEESGDIPIAGKISAHNFASMRNAERMGRMPVMIVVDKIS